MNRLFCLLSVGILIAGCDKPTVTSTTDKSAEKTASSNLGKKVGVSTTDGKTSVVAPAKKDGPSTTDEKTVQQARDECQSRIDRYFGGQGDAKLLGFSFNTAELGRGTKAKEIQILRIIPAYDNNGKPRTNSFVGVLRCSANRLTGRPDNQDFDFTLSWRDGKWNMQ